MKHDDIDYFGQSIRDTSIMLVWIGLSVIVAVGTVLSLALGVL